ncbi:unnamed protein product [marine sediment metagenome]|uniref:Uncharacterized protein n=1 Tax=marine sediment metagenome TaxID=412755 RepID=X0Y2E6_9ZZZZ
MNKLIAILIILIMGMLLISGCIEISDDGEEETGITSEAGASEAVTDLGSDISGISETLNSIDEDLG